MDSLLSGLHAIVGRLMYARNFFIALYDHASDSLRFIYFADEVDGRIYDPEVHIPAAQLKDSFTLAIIRQARTVRGPGWDVARQLGLPRGPVVGTPSVDFLGVPMRRGSQVLGAIAVQSYREGMGYTESDSAVLGFVAEHVLTALERRQGQQALEQRVQERTHELAQANQQLQMQIAERERSAEGGAVCPPSSGSGDVPDIPAGGRLTFTVPAQLAANAEGDIPSTVFAGSLNDPMLGDNFAVALVKAYQADVSVSGRGPSTPVQAGSATSYGMVVTNTGPNDARDVAITNTLDASRTDTDSRIDRRRDHDGES